MLKNHLKRVVAVAVLSCAATLAFAEDAPVYDADAYPPSFDGQADSGLAPPPSQSAYVPNDPGPSLSLEQRVSRAEHQISSIQSKDLSSKIDSLQSEVQSLRGQVEQLTHQLQQAQTQQRTQYSDLDKRISSAPASKQSSDVIPDDTIASTPPATPVPPAAKPKFAKAKGKIKVETKTEVAAAGPAKVSDQQPNVAEEQQIYQTAYDLIKAKKYNEAIAALQKMLQKYPSGQFAANAHYWLGELYGLLGKNEQSGIEFGSVVKNYPDSPKVSDAQLKLGLILAAQFKWADAKSAFKKVINHYPGTASARLAAEQLKQIREAGH